MRFHPCVVAGLAALGLGVMPVTARAQLSESAASTAFRDDVHARAGLACESCHGPAKASSRGRATYSIPRSRIAPTCAACHADGAYMRKFAPQVRVDQYAQYQTSVHGQQMAKGQDRVATCSDCHQAHGVRRVSDARSPVAPANVEQTCAVCHADAARMAPFNRSAEIPAEWSKSVHAEALLMRGDRSAPTCNTCHGSHGATPPDVDSVANVCAQCHVREAELFHASPKREIFEALGQAACIVCHSNHQIERPDSTWIGLETPAVCATCHDNTTESGKTISAFKHGFEDLERRTSQARQRLARATEAGMLVEDGEAALRTAVEATVRLRVLVHAFANKPFSDGLDEGLKAADAAQLVGDHAMAELQYRRRGLGVATLVILGFLGTLFVKIRRLPRPSA